MNSLKESHERLIGAMVELKDELERHETYCRGLKHNLTQELDGVLGHVDHTSTQPVEAASRLRELIGLK